MRRIRLFFASGVGRAMILTFIVGVMSPGCGDDKTMVAEGDAMARRKNKDEALNRMLNPNGAQGDASKSKTSRPRSAKEAAIDEMHLP